MCRSPPVLRPLVHPTQIKREWQGRKDWQYQKKFHNYACDSVHIRKVPVIIGSSVEEFRKRGDTMRHALAYETVGLCQSCGEALTSRDVLATAQARLCPTCWEAGKRQSVREVETYSAHIR